MSHGRSPRHVRKRRPRRTTASTPEAAPAIVEGRVRLQKILAGAGIASRRKAETYLREGRVSVNGAIAQLGDSADPISDKIALDGERVAAQRPSYWMVHKPTGVLCTVTDPERRRTVLDLLPPRLDERVFPVGRLDRDTEGLVLLTNDGALAHTLLHPSLGNEREYRVTAKGDVDQKVQRRIARGVPLEDGRTAPAAVTAVRYDGDEDCTTFQLILVQGRKRQIRRMMLAVRHPVRRLVRIRMGTLKLGRLAKGEARPLRPDEIRALRQHAVRLREDAPSALSRDR